MTDVYEVGQLYQTSNSRGIAWAAVTACAIAAATAPGATVESVIEAVRRNVEPFVAREIERGLDATSAAKNFREMRKAFDAIYSGKGVPYAFSYANEVVTKAMCVFRMTKGNTWAALIAGVNMGRDTDCLTAVAAGIAGALTGGGSIPEAVMAQVDRAAKMNPYTNSQRTLREHADGLYGAFRARLERMGKYAGEMLKA